MTPPALSTVRIPGFRIETILGQGGAATVYLATQASLDRAVAIKVQSTVLTDDPNYSQRFLNEGRIIASLSHPNIITVHDVGVVDGLHYIVMEHVAGGDLNARLAAGMDPGEALALIRTLGNALHFAHRAGVVHRDVKPGNILFRSDGTPLLTDFGIAKRAHDDLTVGGTVLGTPGYLSPEQARGKKVDERSDVYGLGIILYEMLTGRRPYEAETQISTILKQLEEPIPELPPALERFQPLVNRMIARDPAERFPDMSAMLAELDALAGAAAPPVQRSRRARLPLGIVAAGAGVLAIAAALYLGYGHGTGPAFGSRTGTGADTGADGAAAPPPAPSPSVPQPPRVSAVEGPASERLAALGREALEAGRLASPPERNAIAYFQRALELDGGNRTALAGLGEIASRYEHATERALRAKDFVAAREHAELGLVAQPDHARLAALATEARGTLARIDALLAAGKEALDDYRLTTPAGDNALHYYDAVLAIRPGDARAMQGKARIVARYAALAEEKIATYQYADARELIRRGLAIRPGDRQLLALRSKASVKQAPAQLVEDIKRLFD